MRRTLVLLLALAAALVGGARPAAADPAKPGDFRSEVTEVVPAVDGVSIEVAGGDSFLHLVVDPGHEVVVYGYEQDDPTEYLRFLPDGTVQRNLRSPATYINEDRFAAVEAPADLSPDDEPEWETVASGGEFAWHDHRMHWMSPDDPPGVARGAVVPNYDPWIVPLRVDGRDVEVRGTLVLEEPTPSLLWFGLVVVAAVALAALAAFRRVPVAAAALLVGAIAAVAVGTAEYLSIPPGGGASLLTIVVPALGAVAALVAVVRSRAPAGAIAALAATALLAGWAGLRIGVLLEPVLVSDLPPAVDRLGTVLALGAAIAAAVVVVRSGLLRLPELNDDE